MKEQSAIRVPQLSVRMRTCYNQADKNIGLANIEKLARGLRVKPGDLFKGIR